MLPLYNHFLMLFEILCFKHIRMKKPEKKFLLITGVQLVILLAFRGINVGIDTPTYHKDIIYIVNGSTIGFEIGNILLIRAIYAITSSVQVIIAVYAIFTILLLHLGIYRTSKNVYISVILYAGLMYYNFAFTGMRQALALSIVVFSFSFLYEKKYIKTIALIFIAFLFHQSAILALVAVLFDILRNRLKIKNIFIIFIVFYTLIWIFTNRIIEAGVTVFSEYAWYITGYRMSATSIINLLFYFGLLIVCSYFAYNTNVEYKQKENNIRFITILAIGVAFYIMATRFRLMNRMTMYFTIIVIYLLPSTFEYCVNKKLLNASTVVIATLYFIILVVIKSNNMIPYNFFWTDYWNK